MAADFRDNRRYSFCAFQYLGWGACFQGRSSCAGENAKTEKRYTLGIAGMKLNRYILAIYLKKQVSRKERKNELSSSSFNS